VGRSLRRDGHFLVAVGAVLGVVVGIILGLAVQDPQASTAVAAPRPARAAALAATHQDGQPTVAQPAGSEEQADGDASTSRQRPQSAYRPDQALDQVHKDSKPERKKDKKESRKRANGKPGEDNAGMGKSK
jgi:hypothetical protein